jgi:hypothetical protein
MKHEIEYRWLGESVSHKMVVEHETSKCKDAVRREFVAGAYPVWGLDVEVISIRAV